MCVITNNAERVHEFEREQGGLYGSVERRKEMNKLSNYIIIPPKNERKENKTVS